MYKRQAWEDSLTVSVTGPAGPRVAPEVDLERVQAHLEEELSLIHISEPTRPY